MRLPVIPEETWANSHMSIARYYGGIILNKEKYVVCNKHGITVFELSDPNSKYYVGDGEQKCIAPGEPCDLVNEKWIPVYKKLGRDRVLELVNQHKTLEECKKIAKEEGK